MGSAEDTFETALSDFKKRLTPKELGDFKATTLEDVRKEIARIQSEQESLKTMMNMSRIQSFLEAMDQFGQVIEVFLNASNFVAFVWGPLKFVLRVASTWADSFDALLEAYDQIGEQIPLLQQYSALFQIDSHMRKVLGLMYSDILDFHRGAVRFFSGRVWRQIFRSVWKDFGSRFKHILSALGRHKELIESQAALLHFRQYQHDSQANLSHIQQYQQDRLQLIQQLERLEEADRDRKYAAVLEWMSGAQNRADHESFCKTRQEYPGTGDWILKHEKVQNWKDADTPVSSTLWLNGIPGAGKTILASAIIDACTEDKVFATGYFYCRDGDPEKNKCIAVFRGLLSQLLNQCRDLIPYCYDKLFSSGESTLNSETLAKQLLELFFQKIPKQYITIDGLDECDITERKSIMSFFTTMVDRHDEYEPGKLRVLFISQDFNDIRKSLPTAAVISLGPTDNQNDIKLFVDVWALKIQQKHGVNDRQIEHIKSSTCARAQSMFLYAKLVMCNLYDQPTRQQLLEEIVTSRFPLGLEQAYERIMSRIKRDTKDEEWKIAHKLLGWMVCAKRPLKWHEIQGAVSINAVEQSIQFDDRQLRFHIRDICGSLIQVSPGDRLELVHSTAGMFILSTGYVRELTVECNLTALCLQYLTFECFEKDITQDQLCKFAIDGYFVFQDYAVAKWFHHFNAMIKAGQDLTSGDDDLQAAIDKIDEALDDFTVSYEEEVMQEPVVSGSEDACNAFRKCDFYDNLLFLWSHINRHQEKGFEARNEVSIKLLSDALARNRKVVEEFTSTSSGQTVDLTPFYGEKRYKCPKLTCFYFHEGFKDAKSRQLHINRHDRPFNCTFPDCSVSEFGFASNKDLEKHMRFVHPETSDQANTFAAVNAVSATTPWGCHLCDKRFTRGFHLRNHIRSHKGERPFACSECGKAFTRANDCKRHEKIHARR